MIRSKYPRARAVSLAFAFVAGSSGFAHAVGEELGEPPIQEKGSLGLYFKFLHERVHEQWAAFIAKQDPLEMPRKKEHRRVILGIVATRDGLVQTVTTVGRARVPKLESRATALLRESAPWPTFPPDGLADDGKAYLEWTFAWDERLCSGIKIVPRPPSVQEAVPPLLAENRDVDAWALVQDAAGTKAEPLLSWFGKLWLNRALADSAIAGAAGVALLRANDRSGLRFVEGMLRTGAPDTPAIAELLTKNQVPVCPLVNDNLLSPGQPQEMAFEALRISFGKECIPNLVTLLSNTKNPAPIRMAALKLLATSPEPSAGAAIDALQNDPSAAIRGAAMAATLSTVGPGGGKAVIYKLVPLIKDSNVEVRGAAYAAIIRAGGDAELAQIYMLFKEKDALPFEKAAAELGRSSTPATGELLGKLLHREDRRVRLAAAKAVLGRHDATARELAAGLASDQDPAIRALLVTPQEAAAAAAISVTGKQLQNMPLPDARKIYAQIVNGTGRTTAGEWLMARLFDLDPVIRCQVLGEWLAGVKPAAVAKNQ